MNIQNRLVLKSKSDVIPYVPRVVLFLFIIGFIALMFKGMALYRKMGKTVLSFISHGKTFPPEETEEAIQYAYIINSNEPVELIPSRRYPDDLRLM